VEKGDVKQALLSYPSLKSGLLVYRTSVMKICTYDEGLLPASGEFTGYQFTVKRVDCWCTGDRTAVTAEIIK